MLQHYFEVRQLDGDPVCTILPRDLSNYLSWKLEEI
jgi:hypothetical protein